MVRQYLNQSSHIAGHFRALYQLERNLHRITACITSACTPRPQASAEAATTVQLCERAWLHQPPWQSLIPAVQNEPAQKPAALSRLGHVKGSHRPRAWPQITNLFISWPDSGCPELNSALVKEYRSSVVLTLTNDTSHPWSFLPFLFIRTLKIITRSES